MRQWWDYDNKLIHNYSILWKMKRDLQILSLSFEWSIVFIYTINFIELTKRMHRHTSNSTRFWFHLKTKKERGPKKRRITFVGPIKLSMNLYIHLYLNIANWAYVCISISIQPACLGYENFRRSIGKRSSDNRFLFNTSFWFVYNKQKCIYKCLKKMLSAFSVCSEMKRHWHCHKMFRIATITLRINGIAL